MQNNVNLIIERVRDNIRDAMEAAGSAAVDMVQNKIMFGYDDLHGKPPHTEIVDTGALFDSIHAEVHRESQNLVSVSVGTNLRYAKYVHEGTSKLKGRRFITDALLEGQERLKQIIENEVNK